MVNASDAVRPIRRSFGRFFRWVKTPSRKSLLSTVCSRRSSICWKTGSGKGITFMNACQEARYAVQILSNVEVRSNQWVTRSLVLSNVHGSGSEMSKLRALVSGNDLERHSAFQWFGEKTTRWTRGGLEPLTRHGLNQIRADARKRSVVAPKRCAQDGKKFCRKTLMREARNPIRADARKRSVVAPQRCAQNGKKSCRKTLTQPAYARRSTEIGPSLTLRVTMGEKVAMSDC